MMTIRLRAAGQSDADAIRDCITSAYGQAMREIADLPDVTAGLAEDIRDRDVVLAESDGHLLGVIVFDLQTDTMMVFNLAVSPEAQGQGIARQLLAAAETAAVKAEVAYLQLRTHRLMHATRAMYAHLGWNEVETTGNSVMMQKRVA